MRIVYDVSPLSHPLTGVGNYVRGSLAGLVEAAGGAHEIVAFAPTSPAGRSAIPRALDGIDVELQLVPLPFSQRWRDAWSRLGRPALERFLGGFDVFHYSDWMYPPQAGGVRATTVHDLVPLRFPEWVTPKTRRDARRQVREHGAHCRSSSSSTPSTRAATSSSGSASAGAGPRRATRA